MGCVRQKTQPEVRLQQFFSVGKPVNRFKKMRMQRKRETRRLCSPAFNLIPPLHIKVFRSQYRTAIFYPFSQGSTTEPNQRQPIIA